MSGTKLRAGMKVICTRTGHIGKIKKLGGRTSKVFIPIFGEKRGIIRQIPNSNLVERVMVKDDDLHRQRMHRAPDAR